MAFNVAPSSSAAQLQTGLAAADGLGTPEAVNAERTPIADGYAGGFVPGIGVTLDPVAITIGGSYLFDYYYRIWVFPPTLVAQNPQYDTPIPFYVWNAYPQPAENTLEALNVTDGDGITINGLTPAAFDALEYRQMGVVITPDAPGSVDASFVFDFEQGLGFFRFIASIANVLALEFEDGIRVDHAWLTDVLQRYNGDEQRLALRERPRRTFGGEIVLTSDAERRQLHDQIYKVATGLIVIPMYQHQTPLRAATVIGDDRIYCNTKRADLRPGGYVVLIKRDGTEVLARVSEVFADYVTLDAAHAEAVQVAGTKVMSAIATRIPDMSGFSMRAKDGNASLQFAEFAAQDTLLHPLAEVTLEEHQGLPVLEKRPLADDADEKFGTGLTTIDNEIGRPARFTAWDQKYVRGDRSYLINTQFTPGDLDYWFAFLEHCRGQQRSFFASTWREDLVPAGTFTTSTLEVVGTDYSQLYFGTETYANLEIISSAGRYLVTVINATLVGGNTVLEFSPPIADDLTGVTIERISYLMKMRLGSDKVSILYRNTHAILSLSLKAV